MVIFEPDVSISSKLSATRRDLGRRQLMQIDTSRLETAYAAGHVVCGEVKRRGRAGVHESLVTAAT